MNYLLFLGKLGVPITSHHFDLAISRLCRRRTRRSGGTRRLSGAPGFKSALHLPSLAFLHASYLCLDSYLRLERCGFRRNANPSPNVNSTPLKRGGSCCHYPCVVLIRFW